MRLLPSHGAAINPSPRRQVTCDPCAAAGLLDWASDIGIAGDSRAPGGLRPQSLAAGVVRQLLPATRP